MNGYRNIKIIEKRDSVPASQAPSSSAASTPNRKGGQGSSSLSTPVQDSQALLIASLSKTILSSRPDEWPFPDNAEWDKLDKNDDYLDSRIELKNCGHNLTSVLVNPRETVLDIIMDDLEIDKSFSLDWNGLMSNLLGGGSVTAESSDYVMTSLAAFPPTTVSQLDYLNRLLNSMKRLFKDYDSALSRGDQQQQSNKHVGSNPLGDASHPSEVAAAADLLKCFSQVPELFFSAEFTLTDINTFNAVFVDLLRLNKEREGGRREQPSSSRRQRDQETLSHHLDMVETALLKQIWSRSPAFFRALVDIKDLQNLVSRASNTVSTLRRKLELLDAAAALGTLRVVQLHRRQQNECRLYDKVLCMQQVQQSLAAVQTLVEAEDYLGAMDLVTNVRALYASNHLSGIAVMRRCGDRLGEYEVLISEILSNRFISIAMDHDDSDDSSSSASATPSGPLEQVLRALLGFGRLEAAMLKYKGRLSESLRLIIRTCALEFLSSFDPATAADYDLLSVAANEPDTPFSQRLREMSDDNFLACLGLCFEQILFTLRRCEQVHRFVEAFISQNHAKETQNGQDGSAGGSITGTPASQSNGHESGSSNLVLLSKSCLTSSCDLSQRSIQQLLTIRKESIKQLSVAKMKHLSDICLRFIQSLERAGDCNAYEMRRCLLFNAKDFLSTFHEASKRALQGTLDTERWTQCDVNADRQKELDLLSSGKASLTPAAVTASNSGGGSDDGMAVAVATAAITFSADDATSAVAGVPVGDRSKKQTRAARVEDNHFKACWSALCVTQIVMQYLDITASFPSLAIDVIAKVTELTRLFDKRTRDLVLNAEAIESSARLKSISAKHLAITAQSIGLLLALLPHIRAALLAQIPTSHQMQLVDIDRMSQLLVDHHGLIVDKLVEIAAYSVDSSAINLRKVDWDRFQGQSEYFADILKNISALHRVLLEILPSEQVRDIFSRIFASLSRKAVAHFEEVLPSTQTGKQRIVDEVIFLVCELSKLKQVDGAPLNSLEATFRKKLFSD